jgi:hypothetical protein
MKFPNVYGNGGNGTSGCPKCKKKVGNFCIDDPNKFADPANNCCGTGKVWDDVNQICIDDTSANNAAVVDAVTIVNAIEDATAKSATAGNANNSNVSVVTKVMEKYVPITVADNIATNMKFNLNEAAATGYGAGASNNIATKIFEQLGSLVSSDTSNELSNIWTAIENAWGDYFKYQNITTYSGDGWDTGSAQLEHATSYDTIAFLVSFGPGALPTYNLHWEWKLVTQVTLETEFTDYVNELAAQNYDPYRWSFTTPRSDVFIGRTYAHGDPLFTEGLQEASLREGDIDKNPVPVYGLYGMNLESRTSFISMLPDSAIEIASVFTWYDRDGNSPDDPTELEESHVTGYREPEILFLADRFGYGTLFPSEITQETIVAAINARVEEIALSVVVDEVTSQIINNVIDYGDLKQSHLTSISVSEATQETTEAISSRIEY